MQVKVFSQGMPPDSLWVEPPDTWADIMSGKLTGTEGLYVSVETARRLIAEATEKATSITAWCGSEGGTPRPLAHENCEADEQYLSSKVRDDEERDYYQEKLSHSVRSTDTYNS